jgi:hypothetical protein
VRALTVSVERVFEGVGQRPATAGDRSLRVALCEHQSSSSRWPKGLVL